MIKKERNTSKIMFGASIAILAGTSVLERLAPNMSDEARIASRAANKAAITLGIISGLQLFVDRDEETENKCRPIDVDFEEV